MENIRASFKSRGELSHWRRKIICIIISGDCAVGDKGGGLNLGYVGAENVLYAPAFAIAQQLICGCV
jgi:hypothetical protein